MNATTRVPQQTLLDAVSDLIFVLDRDARILFANRAVLERLGCSPSALVGGSAAGVLGFGRAGDMSPWLPAAASPRLGHELYLRGVDGTRHLVTAHFSYGDWNDEVCVFVVARPISARADNSALSAAHRGKVRGLDQESELSRALLDAPLTAGLVLDRDGTVLSINETGARLYGQPAEAIVGRNIFAYMEDSVAARRRSVLEHVVANGRTLTYQDEREGYILENYICPLLDSEGNVDRVAIVARDVSAEAAALDAVRRQRDLIAEVAEATSHLLAMGDLAEGIQTALARIGRAVGADRAYVYRVHPQSESGRPAATLSFEWSKPGASLRASDPSLTDRELREFGIDDWMLTLEEGGFIRGSAADFAPSARAMMASYQVASLAIVPIFVEGSLWGILGFNTGAEVNRQWSDEEISALRTMAASIGAAVHRAEYEDRLRHEREIANTLRDVGLALTSTLDVEEVLRRLLVQLRRVVPYDAANLMLIEDNKARIKLQVGYERLGIDPQVLQDIELDVTRLADLMHLVATGQPVVCPDVEASPDWVRIDGTEYIESWLGAPIVVFGKVVALFSLDSATRNFYTEEHLRLIVPFTRQAGIALENARLFQQVQQTTDELASKYLQLDALHRAIRAVLSSRPADAVLERLAQEIVAISGASCAAIYTYDDSSYMGTLQSVYEGAGKPAARQPPSRQLSFATPTVRAALEQRATAVLPAAALTAAFPDDRWIRQSHTVTLLPLASQQRISGAVLICDDRPGHSYTADRVKMCEALAHQVTIVIEQGMLLADIGALEQTKSRMIRMASHDLRGPLTRIENYVERLERRLPPESAPQSGGELAHIRRATHEIDQIVSEILSLERIEALHRSTRTLNLADLVRDCLETFGAECAARGLTLAVEIVGEMPDIRGDPAQLRGAICNLIENAVKYTPSGGKISVRAYPNEYHAQRTIAFEVEDSGIGIRADRQARLFEPFFRGEQTGTEGIRGLGLGLSVVKSAVEAHGGRVYFDSMPGQGSLFGFWLPVATR